MLPVTHWWALRDKFKQSIPGVVTDSYLAAALDTKADSARKNILPYLKSMGLIDEDGKTLEIAKAWRDDDQYPKVCEQIRNSIYPEDLFSAVPNPTEDREAAERWFANHTGSGTSAVKRMTNFYIVIAEANISKKPQPKGTKAKANSQTQSAKKKQLPKREEELSEKNLGTPPAFGQNYPGVNINLEIHISADATPDQIDKIFESMAKHIYRK